MHFGFDYKEKIQISQQLENWTSFPAMFFKKFIGGTLSSIPRKTNISANPDFEQVGGVGLGKIRNPTTTKDRVFSSPNMCILQTLGKQTFLQP